MNCGRLYRGDTKAGLSVALCVGSSMCAPLEYVLTANGIFSSHIHQTAMATLGPGRVSRAGKKESPGLGVY